MDSKAWYQEKVDDFACPQLYTQVDIEKKGPSLFKITNTEWEVDQIWCIIGPEQNMLMSTVHKETIEDTWMKGEGTVEVMGILGHSSFLFSPFLVLQTIYYIFFSTLAAIHTYTCTALLYYYVLHTGHSIHAACSPIFDVDKRTYFCTYIELSLCLQKHSMSKNHISTCYQLSEHMLMAGLQWISTSWLREHPY